jgi:hypothetical protein
MNNFILESTLDDLTVCDELIDYHKNSPNKISGGVIDDNGKLVTVPKVKISTDVILLQSEVGIKYVNQLQNVVSMYMNKYPYCTAGTQWSIRENITIQYYKPKEGFFQYHTERSSNNVPETYRHLVFMTYLNDVDDEGETEFFYQGIKVKPKKGKTLIWPADWTHTHRGITSTTQEKYIITGWFSYF